VGRLALAVAILLAMSPAIGLADSNADVEIKQLESALHRLDQAQQSVYQQFQMVQALRRSKAAGIEEGGTPSYGVAPPPIDYDTLQQQRKQRKEELSHLADELDRLYAEHQALEQKKRALIDRLNELTETRSEPATR
jgi:hypothetical protein